MAVPTIPTASSASMDLAAGDHLTEDYVHVPSPDPPAAEPSDPGADPESQSASFPQDPGSAAAADAGEDSETAEAPEGSDDGLSRELPDELASSVVRLECQSSAEDGDGVCNVFLVGTAHVSQDSCRVVQEVIRCLKPQVVFLELCPNRVAILTPRCLKVPTVNEMMDMWKKKKTNTFGIIYSWFLAKVADQLDVFPGSEFRVAFEEATSYGAKVTLGDRPVNITLRRTWGKMSLWHRMKFLYYLLFQTIFLPSPEDLNKMLKEMDDIDMLTLVIQEMSKAFPMLMETLLHERDMYMSSVLLKVASEHSSVVAVVGKGHVQGIKKHWKQPIEVEHLLEMPTNEGTFWKKIFASAVAATGVAIACYFMGKR